MIARYRLIDRECGSACEDFVMPFKDNRRATLIGETTVGSSGQPCLGAQFEGVGVAPDVPVAWTTDELRSGDDPVLKKARALALR